MRFTTTFSQILFKPFQCMHTNINATILDKRRLYSLHNAPGVKRTNPSCDRNSKPISEALLTQIDRETHNLQLLEIASGCGQHLGYMAPMLPNITFQPSEFDYDHFNSIKAYAADCPTKNILEPLFINISVHPTQWQEAPFAPNSFDYIYNSNMMHISPWICSVGLFRAAGMLLKQRGLLFTYGAYAVNGVLTPQSNIDFNRSLKGRNREWGVRDIADLKMLAANNGMELKQTQEMPSNNKFLTWIKL